MCSGNKSALNPYALVLNKVLLFVTNAFKGVQEKMICCAARRLILIYMF